jgi:hypothetical protein
MDAKTRGVFLALIVAQAAHSVEEYRFRLFDVLAPARFVSGLFSSDLPTGFAIANGLLVLLGGLCYLVLVRPDRPGAAGVIWFWAVLELANGTAHVVRAVEQGGYFPGVATAPVLLELSVYLMSRLRELPPESRRG